jgi:hypothetical protein
MAVLRLWCCEFERLLWRKQTLEIPKPGRCREVVILVLDIWKSSFYTSLCSMLRFVASLSHFLLAVDSGYK